MSKTHRVVVLSDIHLRSDYIPGFLDAQVKSLTRLVNRKPPDSVIIGGDIFHKRNPSGDELLAFDKVLDSFKCKDIYVLRGNHDTIHKDGTSESTLSLFENKAKIITDTKTYRIGSATFDFIPHYESEEKIVDEVKKSKNHIFGHFGFNGCISNGFYAFETKLKKWHFPKKKLAFLGHIHKPKKYDNIYVIGTPYSNSYGEANAVKMSMELLIRDGNIEVIRKPIDFGIRHVECTVDELPSANKKFKFDSFFTMLRVKLDRLDEYVERQLHDKLITDYKIDHLELSFEDILPKFGSSYSPDTKLISLDDKVIEDYLDSRDSIFSKEELLEALKLIKDEN
jgi:DNA repair exonuclease SbcCD nuclease subunit